jgi:uncharacterized protein YjbI with pentapeptide repeats
MVNPIDFRGKKVIALPEIRGREINSTTEVNGEKIVLLGEDLQEADFDGMIIRDLDLSNTSLQGTSFRGAQLINVQINHAETGITDRSASKLKRVSSVISCISGIIGAYSINFFLYLIVQNLRSSSYFQLFLMTFFLVMLGSAILWILSNGMRKYFFFFPLLIVLASFLVQVFTASGDIAATSGVGLACFVGGLASFAAQSQASYLRLETIFLIGQRDKPSFFLRQRSKGYEISWTSILGIIIGIITASEIAHALPTLVLSLAIIVLGNRLGFLAHLEKKKGKPASNVFFEYPDRSSQPPFSISLQDLRAKNKEEIIKDFLAAIEMIKEKRSDYAHSHLKYASIRASLDAAIDNLKTSFDGTSLIDVTFYETDLNQTCFKPCNVELSEMSLDDASVSSEVAETLEKNEDKIRLLFSFLYILSNVEKQVVNINQPVFGGGLATKGGMQVGGAFQKG